jgi:anthranilate/para-aminobenzoate synthase component I
MIDMIMNEKITFKTSIRKMLADVHTPVGIYLRLRDRFRDTLLLESSDHHSSQDNWSFICIQAIAGIELVDKNNLEYKLPGEQPVGLQLSDQKGDLPEQIRLFMSRFDPQRTGAKEEMLRVCTDIQPTMPFVFLNRFLFQMNLKSQSDSCAIGFISM